MQKKLILVLCAQFLLNASRDSQTTKTSIKSSFLNQYDNVRHIYISIEFVMKQYSWELDVLISGLWNEQMHAVLITVKCVSFVCVNVSVSFLIIFFAQAPLHLKKMQYF